MCDCRYWHRMNSLASLVQLRKFLSTAAAPTALGKAEMDQLVQPMSRSKTMTMLRAVSLLLMGLYGTLGDPSI